MTPDQVRTARVLLGWSKLRLGLRSDTYPYVMTTFEQTGRVVLVRQRLDLIDALVAVRAALEEAGVQFTDGDVPGVRLVEAASTE